MPLEKCLEPRLPGAFRAFSWQISTIVAGVSNPIHELRPIDNDAGNTGVDQQAFDGFVIPPHL